MKNLEQGKITYEELEPTLNAPYFDDIYMIRICSTIITVFSALCLESLINDYGIIKTSSSYFKNYLDKLDTVSKWVIIPKVIMGKSISTDGDAFQLLKDLYSKRNRLVHPKSKIFDNKDDKIIEEFAGATKAVKVGILAIREATKELYKIDESFKYLKFYKPFWGKEKFKKSTSLEKLFHSMASTISDQKDI